MTDAGFGELGVAQTGVLRFVGDAGESRASDIAAKLGVGASALSRQVSDLTDLGMLVRRPDPADGRAHLISLSANGEEFLANIERRRTQTLQEILSGWSEDEACAAARSVENLTAALRSALAIHPSRATKTGITLDQPSAMLAGVN